MIKYNLSGTWHTIKNVYTNINGSWKTVGQISVNVNGTWHNIWSYGWKTGGWGNCSTSCGGGIQTRSVTCQRNDGQTVADFLCTKYVGSKPATSQSCNTQSCKDCIYNFPQYDGPVSGYGNGTKISMSWIRWNGFDIYKNYPAISSCTKDGYLYTPGSYVEDRAWQAARYAWYYVCRQTV